MSFGSACAAAVALPLVWATLVTASIAGGERAGAAPFGGGRARNSAEAAGQADAAEMVRLLRAGNDAARVYPVDPAIISSSVLLATTLEAAVWSRQAGLVELLDQRGAIDSAPRRRALACLAADLAADDIAAYLAPAGTATCVPGAAYARVLARTLALEGRSE